MTQGNAYTGPDINISFASLTESVKKAGKALKDLGSSLHGIKVMENPNLPEGQFFMIGDGTVMVKGIGKPEKPATMPLSPKKGLNVKELAIYRFGAVNDPVADGADPKHVLGGKGAGLAEMVSLKLPVPPGYVIPCDASVAYLHGDAEYRAGFMQGVMDRIKSGEKYLSEMIGYLPLVSVRSGARVSMPGMMDTILNVGIGDWNLDEWKDRIGERPALDSFRRFLQMYGATAMGIPAHEFEAALKDIKAAAKVEKDSELSASYLIRLIKRYKDIFAAHDKKVPALREEALKYSIMAVFESWNNDRAKVTRKEEGIPDDWGTAVTVQAMVFGNMNDKSCSGVAFTRDKATGKAGATGDFIVNAQGEDVVAAGAPTQPLVELKGWNEQVYGELLEHMGKLEAHYRDMQDVEFTVQDGQLWMLQTRKGKRSAEAAFQIAFNMVNEGLISKDEAVARVSRDQLLTILKPRIDPAFKGKPIAKGLGVGGTVVTGVVCLTSSGAQKAKEMGQNAILVRHETDPDDIEGILASVGVLTATGGTTSHAAVVANGYDKTCVVGCAGMHIVGKGVTFGDGPGFMAGDLISIDGATGNVYKGEVPVIEATVTSAVQAVALWAADGDYAYRITPANTMELCHALHSADAGVVYVDTCMLPMDTDFVTCYKAVIACKAKQVVFDLSHVDGSYGHCDKVMNRMFGWDPMLGQGNKRAMSMLEMPAEAAIKCVVKLPGSCTLGDKLRKKGFKVIGPVKTVADLLEADGAVEIDEDTIINVFGSKDALLWVQNAMGKAGKSPSKPLPKPVYWYEPIMRKGA